MHPIRTTLLLSLLGLTGCPSTPAQGGASPTPAVPVLRSLAESSRVQAASDAACVPTTCEFLVATCGEVSDGCGGTLHCGGCASGQTCGGDGLAHVCSARASAPAVQWLKTLPAGVSGLATGQGASIFYIRDTEGNDALGLLGPEGGERWTRSELEPRVNFAGVSVTPSGELLAWGRPEGSASAGASIYRFDATGDLRATEHADNVPEHCSQDAAGNMLGYDHTYSRAFVRYQPRVGQGWSLQSTPRWAYPPAESWDPFYFQTVTPDPRGGALVSGSLQGEVTLLGQPLGKAGQVSSFVLRVSPEGKLVRAWELPDTDAALLQLGTSASGLVVGRGNYVGSLRWPGGTLGSGDTNESRPFLMALDEQGPPAWVRPLPWPMDAGLMAVSAGGQIALANGYSPVAGREPSALHVRVYDARGNLEWSRSFTPSTSTGSVSVGGLDWSGEQLVLAGSFSGAVDFGAASLSGRVNPTQSGQGFILKFRDGRPGNFPTP